METRLSIKIRCPINIDNGRQVEFYVVKPGFIRACDTLAWVAINNEGAAIVDVNGACFVDNYDGKQRTIYHS